MASAVKGAVNICVVVYSIMLYCLNSELGVLFAVETCG
jgi:hypothetical protein